MSDLYTSGEYAAKNPNWHMEHSPWKASQVMRMIERHKILPHSIAEVGCGAGAILEYLHGKLTCEPQCTGYEISPQAYNLAKTRECQGLSFHLGKLTDTRNTFDLLLAMDVLEHVEDYIGFIRDLKPYAKWKILHIPLDLSFLSILRPNHLHMARKHVGHLHYFTLETALASIEDAGLRVQDWFFTCVELDLGTSGQKRIQWLRKELYRWRPHLAARWLGNFSVLVLAE